MKLTAEMSISFSSAQVSLDRILRRCESLRSPVHHAMAVQFRQCVYDNFGASGSFRIHQWAKLSPAYARQVHRDYATLNVTGKLRSAIKMSANSDKGKVSINKGDCEYALAHQFGYPKNNLPARPYFPIHTDGKVMVSVQQLVKQAAALALTLALRRR